MIFQNAMNNCNNSYGEVICNLDKLLFPIQRQSGSLKPHSNKYWSNKYWIKGECEEGLYFIQVYPSDS